MNIKDMNTPDLLATLAQLERITVATDTPKLIRMELFRRGVSEFNGVPLETLLRNPVLRAEYEEATKG
jgi:orotate phosphoribosyltransferase-like protein